MKNDNQAGSAWGKSSVRDLVLLLITVFVAHFLYFREFGLYEDDYAHVSPAMGWSWFDLLNHAADVFASWPQGRPLNFFLPQLFSFIGTQLGGLHVTYLIAFSIVALNAVLFYALLRRVSSEAMAVTGALAFNLFPADTTQTFLVHAFHLQTSLTFLLIASLCYVSGRRVVSYLIIPWSLLAYESPYMVFLALPLLKAKWDRSLLKELGRHVAILLGIIVVLVVIRASMGEERIAEVTAAGSNIGMVARRIGVALVIGPAVSLAAFAYGPARTVFHWSRELTVVFVACLVVFTWWLHQLTIGPLAEKQSRAGNARLLLTSLVMLSLAYAVSFTHFPPTALYGRLTSVHLAAAFGGSLLFACVCSAGLSVANSHRLKSCAVVLLALYLSLVVAYRFSIQLDFRQAWKNQQSFWASAVKNLPDMTDGTIVFVQDDGLSQTRYIRTHSWADPIMLGQMFQFPASWENPPRLFVVRRGWTESLVHEGNQFKWKVPTATWWSHWEVLPSSNVILLKMEEGKLVRSSALINVHGSSLQVKPMPADGKPKWPKGPLFRYLIDRPP